MNNDIQLVTAVDRAIDILTLLSRTDKKSIRELSEDLEISKTTVHRILQTLEYKGMVFKDENTDKYLLGYKMFELTANLKENHMLIQLSRPYLKKLNEITGETIQLAVIKDENILVIDSIEGTGELRLFAQPGQVYPLDYGNFGKIFLSQFESSYPIDISKELKEKIDEVKNNGIAVGIDDPIIGSISLAVPIYNSSNKIIASISQVGVKTDEKLDQLEELKKKIIECAKNISNEIKS